MSQCNFPYNANSISPPANAMTKSKSAIVNTIQTQGVAELTKTQKQFNKLLKKIETLRADLGEWHTTLPLYRQKYSGELVPLLDKHDALRIDLVKLLDTSYSSKSLSKTDLKKLDHLIPDMIESIWVNTSTPELDAIYGKYRDDDSEMKSSEIAESLFAAEMKESLEEMLGVPVDDDIDFNDPDAVLKFMQAKEQEWEQQQSERQQAKQHAQSKRKKSPKQIASEAKKAEEEKAASLSIREVYRKLASALHPDREPDETERKRKTELMQRVNVAYEKKDLLQLLTLQLEVEQIDQNTINTISEDKLKHYNKVLTEQARELEVELMELSAPMELLNPFVRQQKITPQSLMRTLHTDIAQTSNSIALLQRDLRELTDPKEVKAMLKTYRIPKPRDWDDDFMFGF
jgi:hypothetical protein